MDIEFLNSPQGAIVCVIGAILLVATLFNVNQVKAHWKDWAIDASNACSQAGCTNLAQFFRALGAGDLKGTYTAAKAIVQLFQNPAQLAAEFGPVLAKLQKDPVAGPLVQKFLSDAAAGASAQQLAADAQAAARALPQLPAPPSLSLLPHLAANPALQAVAHTALALGLPLPQAQAFVAGHAAATAVAAAASAATDSTQSKTDPKPPAGAP